MSSIKKILIGTMLLWFLSSETILAAPYTTLTKGPDGFLVPTQTAYEPSGLIKTPLNSPEDLYIEEATAKIYIADTGNSRILVLLDGQEYTSIGEGILSSPTGVYVQDELLYVADYGNKKIYLFNKEGKLIKEIGRPSEPLFGKNTDFNPRKVVVDKRSNIYVISEGSVNGVVQLNQNGNFIGFVGSNRTEISFKMLLQQFFFTEAQKGQLFKKKPPSPTSVGIDRQGLLYTVTSGIREAAIKKLNVLGNNILPDRMVGDEVMLDLDVDQDGNIYAISQQGYIYIYDSFGQLLFLFGGTDNGQERIGFVKNPTAIEVTSDGKFIYIVDKERNVINLYEMTYFASSVKKGVVQYKQGYYLESKNNWNEILRMNSFFILSYRALAKAYFKEGDYKAALDSFRLAEDRQGYSDAFWQVRNEWLQKNAAKGIIILAGLLILRVILRWLNRKTHIFRPVRIWWRQILEVKLIKEIIFSFYFLRHPIDGYYELKENKRASVLSATILYIWFIFLQILLIYATAYIFTSYNLDYIDLVPLLLNNTVPFLFWIITHYLVSTISDGEGRLSEVYIGTIYALTPYLIFALPIALVSNLLTYNEAFLYTYSMFFIKGWSLLLIFLMVKEIHNYSVKESLRNIFITLFGIVMIALLLFILVLLFNQEIDFIRSIIQELRTRV